MQSYDVDSGPVAFHSFKSSPDPPNYLGKTNAALQRHGLSASAPKWVQVGLPLWPLGMAGWLMYTYPQHWKQAAGVGLASVVLMYAAVTKA
jgi:hypothetical protein